MQTISVYQDTSDDVLEQFVLQHRHLVRKIALHIKRRLPSHVELDDLLQSGLLGLLEARDHYKDNLGASFETYASIRIRGSILDSLRRNSSMSREMSKNMRRVSQAIATIEQRNQRPARTEEIAAELEISLEDFFAMSQDINVCYLLNLEDISQDTALLSDDSTNPQAIIQDEGVKEQLKVVLQQLPEREQLVLSLYYVEEFTFKEIGEIMKVTEARICQLHSQAIARVRNKLQKE